LRALARRDLNIFNKVGK